MSDPAGPLQSTANDPSPATRDAPPITPEGEKSFGGDDDVLSAKVTLADLCAKGTSQYAIKNYAEAMDHFAQASELQAEINGEMSPENAEILFLYGRCLYKVGQSKSDVLGGKSGGEEKSKKQTSKNSKPKAATLEAVAEKGEAEGNGTAAESSKPQASGSKVHDGPPSKPFFQFTGDENFEDSDEDEEEAEGAGDEDEEEEEDELLLGFEILDLARVLFERRLQQAAEVDDANESKEDATNDEEKATGKSSLTKHLKERLADCHDLLGDISLENERFPQAIGDFKASLGYKQELHPTESEIIAEAHFKLSLALEFGSITTTSDATASAGAGAGGDLVNEDMRSEAAAQLNLAIESTKLKLHNKEVSLAETASPEENDTTRAQIGDVKEILADMEQRLIDLRTPPIDVTALLNASTAVPATTNATSIMHGKDGETRADVAARLEAAKKSALDVQGLARKKGASAEDGGGSEPLLVEKRKRGDGGEGGEEEGKEEEGRGKKARVGE